MGWLSERTGKRYRLPSEAEWEYAARAGTTTMRYRGHDAGNADGCLYANAGDLTLADALNFSDKSSTNVFQCYDGSTNTAPVAGYVANAFGLHDMLGNVWEWSEDCWNASYAGAPADGRPWLQGDCALRVVRGGSWSGRPGLARAAVRYRVTSGIRSNHLGFRVASTPGRLNPRPHGGAGRACRVSRSGHGEAPPYCRRQGRRSSWAWADGRRTS